MSRRCPDRAGIGVQQRLIAPPVSGLYRRRRIMGKNQRRGLPFGCGQRHGGHVIGAQRRAFGHIHVIGPFSPMGDLRLIGQQDPRQRHDGDKHPDTHAHA